jgi:hypothetical protein
MGNFNLDCLKEGNLTDAIALDDILGKAWDDEMIRYAYPIAINKLLKTHQSETIRSLIDMDGKSILTQIDHKYYLFESIDIWQHEVYATDDFMQLIIKEMNNLLKQ